MKERLAYIKGRMSKGQTSVYYVRYNPSSPDIYDTEEATEDLQSPRSLAGKWHAAPGRRANARLS